MAATLHFELVSPERILVTGEANEVVVPGLDGQLTVLPGHAPVIATLRPGVLEVHLASGLRRVFVRGGIAEVEPDRLTILSQHSLDLDSLDAKRAADELKSAQAMLADAKDDTERMVAQDAIDFLSDLPAHTGRHA